MDPVRKPFQGVWNIIRFNWHFYVLAGALVLLLCLTAIASTLSLQPFLYIACFLIVLSTTLSLLASLYVYDLSGLYRLDWIQPQGTERLIVNINAGFDETSHLLQAKFSGAELMALDFYDPEKHTEVSIQRARKAYPPFPGTIPITTTGLPLADHSADIIFVILSAHEIRNPIERGRFFKALARAIKPTGQIYVTEHLRDFPNFLVYNIGCFHFYSKRSWLNTFNDAGLSLQQEIKLTPFISTFILNTHGTTL